MPRLLRAAFGAIAAERQPVIVSFARTPIGSFNGALSRLKATELGAIVVRKAVERAGLQPHDIEELFMGNVLSAGLRQAPARQTALFGGLPDSVPCTTINKVCASGMKSVMLGAQSIMLGLRDVMVVGGMESMTNVPHMLLDSREGFRYGNAQLVDGLLWDGLTDVYNNFAMGNCAEDSAVRHRITREAQDDYALLSYQRTLESVKAGVFGPEITPVPVPQRKGDAVLVAEDEEPGRGVLNKARQLKPAFQKDGTVTAFNSSKLNDGACAFVLMSAGKAKQLGCKPLAKVVSFSDSARPPIQFTDAPADAIPIAVRLAGLSKESIDYYEINEAFAAVALVNQKLLGLREDQLNVLGGAVALGHPIGMSGARIIGQLMNVLKRRNGRYGCASICNGGGGASAVVIERVDD